MNEIHEGNSVLFSVLAYFGPLFLIGLLVSPEKDDPFVKCHVNNGIWLFIVCVAGGIIAGIPLLGWIIGALVELGTLIFFIIGIVKAINGEMYEYPIVGSIKIVK